VPHPDEDDLALLALGEPLPAVAAHVSACAPCTTEVGALRSTVATARSADLDELAPPPPSVWDRIAAELDLQPAVPPVPPERSRRGRLVAGALALAACVAGVVVLTGGPARAPALSEASSPLTPVGDVAATGRVVLAAEPDRRSLLVDTSGLPAPDGFYEVWLLDLERGGLVPLGALDESGRGWLTVPEGVRIADYPTVDVSVEPDDGDPGHSGASVLRGDVPA